MSANTAASSVEDSSFDVDSVLKRCGPQISQVLSPADGARPFGPQASSRLRIKVLARSSDAIVARISLEGKSCVLKAFNPDLLESRWRTEREVQVLKVVRTRGLAPDVLAYSMVHSCVVMEFVEGTVMSDYLTADNLAHAAHRLGTWFRVFNSHMPVKPKPTDWNAYLRKYENLLTPDEMDRHGPFFASLPIEQLAVAKNDAFLQNFMRSSSGRLIGLDFESAMVKPVGWDLLVTGRVLAQRFPDRIVDIARALVGGWGSSVGAVPAPDFARFVSFFAGATADRRPKVQADPLRRFHRGYNARASQDPELRTAANAFQVPYTDDRLVPPTEAERAALRTSLLAEAEKALAMAPDAAREAEAEVDPKPPSALLKAACATCRGRCCYEGLENHAFIKARKMRVLADRNPGMTAAQLAEYYVDQVPAAHVAGQCLYHSETGCSLSREDRSLLCNTYLCRYGHMIEAAAPAVRSLEVPTLVASIEDGDVMRSTLADSSEKVTLL